MISFLLPIIVLSKIDEEKKTHVLVLTEPPISNTFQISMIFFFNFIKEYPATDRVFGDIISFSKYLSEISNSSWVGLVSNLEALKEP